MKKILTILALWTMGITPAYTQLESGSIVYPMTLKDIYENWYTLYDVLDEGKVVILNIFMGESPNCWTYHTTQALQDFYNAHGPNGDNTARVFALGGYAPYLVPNCCYPTQGNWLEGTPYPIISSGEGLEDEYWSSGYNMTLLHDHGSTDFNSRNANYLICPDKRIYKIGLGNAEELYADALTCGLASQTTDVQIMRTEMNTFPNCPGEARPVNVYLSNMGTEPLTTCDIVVSNNNEVIQTYPWSGNLASYQFDSLGLNDIVLPDLGADIRIYASNPNELTDLNTANDTLHKVLEGALWWDADTVSVEIHTDGYGHQLYWDIKRLDGVTIDSGGNVIVGMLDGAGGPIDVGTSYNDFAYITKNVVLPDYLGECYTIRVLSGYGYGICCDFGNGFIRFKRNGETIYEFTDFGRRAYEKIYTTSSLALLDANYSVTHETGGTANGTIKILPSGGLPSYQFSNNCGDTLVSSNVFTGLSAGLYCMFTRDTLGQLVIDTVEVMNISATQAATYGNAALSVQPNPAKDMINVSLSGVSTSEATATVTLYDATGRVVREVILQRQGGAYRASVSVADMPQGVYVLRSKYAAAVRVVKQ